MKTRNMISNIALLLLLIMAAAVAGCTANAEDATSTLATDEKALSQAPQPPCGGDGKFNGMGPLAGKHGKRPAPAELDKNSDGFLSLDEASVMPFMDEEHFKKMDRNSDGKVALDELPPPPPAPPSCPAL